MNITVESQEIEGFPALIVRRYNGGMRYIEKAEGYSDTECVRQLIIAMAKKRPLLDLPYGIDCLPDGSAAERWYYALTRRNPPSRLTFDFRGDKGRFKAFAAEVNALNMDYFDEETAKSLQERFGYAEAPQRKAVVVDAEDIELGDGE